MSDFILFIVDKLLLKPYIGQGLRQDLAKQFGDPIIENNG